MKMETVKFNNDYEKLPIFWEGTQVTLIGIFRTTGIKLRNKFTSFLRYDSKIRHKDNYYPINEGQRYLVLTFIHHNTGKPFTTLRHDNRENCQKYILSIGEPFLLEGK